MIELNCTSVYLDGDYIGKLYKEGFIPEGNPTLSVSAMDYIAFKLKEMRHVLPSLAIM